MGDEVSPLSQYMYHLKEARYSTERALYILDNSQIKRGLWYRMILGRIQYRLLRLYLGEIKRTLDEF